MHQQRGLARRGRALERRRGHRDDHAAAGEVGEHVAQRERTGDRVELVAGLDESRSRLRVEIGAERDDEDVGVEGAGVGLDAFGVGVDGADRRLHELHTGLDEVAVGVTHLLGERSSEHHVELGEPEDEVVALVDEHDVDVVPELFGQPGRQLQAAESRPQHHNTHVSDTIRAPSPDARRARYRVWSGRVVGATRTLQTRSTRRCGLAATARAPARSSPARPAPMLTVWPSSRRSSSSRSWRSV